MRLSSIIQLSEQEKEERGLLYTPGEILQQPEVWQETAAGMQASAPEIQRILEVSDEIILTGAGSSYFIGVAAEASLARRYPAKTVRAIASTEIVMDPETTLPRRPFALVSVARSGNSPEGNAVFRLAEQLRPGLVRHVVITCNEAGELASLAKGSDSPAALVVLPARTNDKGLAMTSSFTSLLVATQGVGFAEKFSEYLPIVESLAKAADTLLAQGDEVMGQVAREQVERAFFVGARPHFGAALESHLKVQEMTGGEVLGKAEDTLGLRHGPMAGVGDETLVLLFGSKDAYRRRYERDLAGEVAAKRLGIARVLVCGAADAEVRTFFHHVLEFDPRGELLLPDDVISPVLVLPAQLFGLHKGMALGLKPDAPSRENVINRVVQGVTIYPYETPTA